MLAAAALGNGTMASFADCFDETALSPCLRHINRAAAARYKASVAPCVQASFQSTTKSFLAWPLPSAPMSS